MNSGYLLIPAPLMFLMMLYLMNQNVMNQKRPDANSSGLTPQELARREAEQAEEKRNREEQSRRDAQFNRVLQHLRGVDKPTLTQSEFVAWLYETDMTTNQLKQVVYYLTGIWGAFRRDDYADFERDVYCELVRYHLTIAQCELIWELIRERLDYFQMGEVTFGLIQQPSFCQSSKLRGDLVNELLEQHRADEMFADGRWDLIVNDLCDDEALEVGPRQQLRHEHFEARAHGY